MKSKINVILSTFVLLSGFLGLYSWILGEPDWLSIVPGAVNMKALTALNFILAGSITLFLRTNVKEFFVPIPSVFLMFSSLVVLAQGSASIFFHFEKGNNLIKTISPGMPSSVTLISFFLIGLSGIFSLFNGGKVAKIIGCLVSGVGALSMLGHFLQMPALYYYVEGFSSGMAIPTSILFWLTGWLLSHQNLYRDDIKTRHNLKNC